MAQDLCWCWGLWVRKQKLKAWLYGKQVHSMRWASKSWTCFCILFSMNRTINSVCGIVAQLWRDFWSIPRECKIFNSQNALQLLLNKFFMCRGHLWMQKEWLEERQCIWQIEDWTCFQVYLVNNSAVSEKEKIVWQSVWFGLYPQIWKSLILGLEEPS